MTDRHQYGSSGITPCHCSFTRRNTTRIVSSIARVEYDAPGDPPSKLGSCKHYREAILRTPLAPGLTGPAARRPRQPPVIGRHALAHPQRAVPAAAPPVVGRPVGVPGLPEILVDRRARPGPPDIAAVGAEERVVLATLPSHAPRARKFAGEISLNGRRPHGECRRDKAGEETDTQDDLAGFDGDGNYLRAGVIQFGHNDSH